MERVVPPVHPRGRSCAARTTVVAAHENVGHCRFNRACELLRAVKFFPGGAERQHRNAGYVLVRELYIRNLYRVIEHGFGCTTIAKVRARGKSEEKGFDMITQYPLEHIFPVMGSICTFRAYLRTYCRTQILRNVS